MLLGLIELQLHIVFLQLAQACCSKYVLLNSVCAIEAKTNPKTNSVPDVIFP